MNFRFFLTILLVKHIITVDVSAIMPAIGAIGYAVSDLPLFGPVFGALSAIGKCANLVGSCFALNNQLAAPET
jgi:hypothetical protein